MFIEKTTFLPSFYCLSTKSCHILYSNLQYKICPRPLGHTVRELFSPKNDHAEWFREEKEKKVLVAELEKPAVIEAVGHTSLRTSSGQPHLSTLR